MREREPAEFRVRGQRAAAHKRSRNRRADEADRAYLEALLEGVHPPASNEVLAKYGKREGLDGFSDGLRPLSSRRYLALSSRRNLAPDEAG